MKKKSKSKLILKIFAIVVALSMVIPIIMNAVDSLWLLKKSNILINII